VVVDDERSRPGRQNLKGFQEFDDAVLLVLTQPLESHASGFRLAVMGFDRLTQRGEQTMVEKWWLIGCSPQLARQEFRVARKKSGEPAGWFMSSASMFGSPGTPAVMS